jgi:hypothetical protein
MWFVSLCSTIVVPVRLVTSISIAHCGGEKMRQRYRPREAKREGLGLPDTLRILEYEKKISTVSTKLEPSLKRYILEHGGSSLIKELILEALANRS